MRVAKKFKNWLEICICIVNYPSLNLKDYYFINFMILMGVGLALHQCSMPIAKSHQPTHSSY